MKKSVTDTLRISTVPLPGGIRHCYVSATMSLASAPEMFHRVTEAVSNCNARILSLVAFAPPGASHMGMRSLEAAFGVPEWPLAWLEHPHGDGPDAVSCQIFALSGAPVRRLESAGRIIGSVYESESAEFCLMGSLLPSGQSLSRGEQCRRLFETMEAALGGAGMNFHHVVRTYPFYLDRGKLMASECRGLGGKIDAQEAERLAETLIARQITEIEEAIALLERYRDFPRGPPGERGIIVHDSEGEHRIALSDSFESGKE